jgi:hypothetical protein
MRGARTELRRAGPYFEAPASSPDAAEVVTAVPGGEHSVAVIGGGRRASLKRCVVCGASPTVDSALHERKPTHTQTYTPRAPACPPRAPCVPSNCTNAGNPSSPTTGAAALSSAVSPSAGPGSAHATSTSSPLPAAASPSALRSLHRSLLAADGGGAPGPRGVGAASRGRPAPSALQVQDAATYIAPGSTLAGMGAGVSWLGIVAAQMHAWLRHASS